MASRWRGVDRLLGQDDQPAAAGEVLRDGGLAIASGDQLQMLLAFRGGL